ncbi:hypothetical protein G7Y79_00018g044600 [Physcia stellaris]|nr:hypothetical protein G7Y79_00018g044600 [Physcia stellaris]
MSAQTSPPPQQPSTDPLPHSSHQPTSSHLNQFHQPTPSPPSTPSARISPKSHAYWSSIPATVNGMLGGYPQISRTDLQGSYLFFQKIRQLYPPPPPLSLSPPPPPPNQELLERALDIGAGIGRVTSSLLSRLCATIDVVEAQAAFAAQVPLQRMRGPGRVGDVYVVGIEEWEPKRKERQYDLVWAQWCLGYLRDEALIAFLSKLSGRRGRDGDGEGGESETVDVFDELDSSVTRSDATFRRCFREAGLRVVRSELQKGFEKGLLPVRFYALRVEEGG